MFKKHYKSLIGISLFIIILIIGRVYSESVSDTYKFKPLFHLNNKYNLQSFTYNNGIYYVGYDIGNNKGMIIAYNQNGHEIGRTSLLPTGHTAGLDYFNQKIYVANGGSKPSIIFIVNFEKSKIVRVINASKYGHGALIAVKDKNVIILHTAIHKGQDEHIFSFIDNYGKRLKKFTLHGLGMAQGMDYKDGIIYFYSDNKITLINEKGKVLKSILLNNFQGESEGLTIVNGKLVIGFNHNNRLYVSEKNIH
ncbi:hypothetical protein EWI07_03895 [Sporolactobacillus sp. THM7-4]|nr:hypothetical protein EWI07_03895 [Sporolactobacillus sp. THM7-4]